MSWRRGSKSTVVALLTWTLAIGSAAASAQPPQSDDEGPPSDVPFNRCKNHEPGAKFTVTLPPGAELGDLVRWMSSISCQQFVWDDKLRLKPITVLSPEPVTMREARVIFYAALDAMGATVEASGDVLKIVETQAAKSAGLPVYGPGEKPPAIDRYVTQVFRVPPDRGEPYVKLLETLKGPHGSVESIDDLVVLTDTGTNVRRMMSVIAEVGVGEGADAPRIFFHQVQHVDATKVAEVLREVLGEDPKKDAESAARVVVDEASGTLIVVARRDDFAVIRGIVDKLDIPASGASRRIHVVKLRHADPEEVVTVLSRIPSIGGASAKKDGDKAPVPRKVAQVSVQGDVELTADPATRKLLVHATQSDFNVLKPVIEELDEKRLQVYIEVHLLEVSVDHDIGGSASGHFGRDFDTPDGKGLGFVSSAPNPDSSSLGMGAGQVSLDGLLGGVLGPQIPGSGDFFGLEDDLPAFGVVIQALETSEDVNILSRPHLYTADNKEAVIRVGTHEPTPGQVANTGSNPVAPPVTSVEIVDVTLEVKITPHVNDDATLTLDVEMTDRGLVGRDERLGVTTSERQIKLDKVVAHNDQPVVLGGLVREREDRNTRQVPGLGSIPLVGWLFKAKDRRREKVNLLMILVPHIIETPDDIRRIEKQRRRERREFMERQTTFKRRDLDANIDYRHKSGLLSTINREVERMEAVDVAVRRAEAELQRPVVSGELGLAPEPPPQRHGTARRSTAPSKTGTAPRKR